MLAAHYTAHGAPRDVISLLHAPPPEVGPGQARVRLLARPIDPMDLLIIRGHYPLRSPLPATPGAEGVGVVEALGPQVDSALLGRRVVLPIRSGTWCEAVSVDASRLTEVSDGVDPIQQCGLAVNGATALTLIEGLRAGDWVMQSCASGGVGQAVIQLAAQRGVRTVAIVRRIERADVVRQLGADVVLVDGPKLHHRVREATGGAALGLALDGVGGSCTSRLARCLAPGGLVRHYGAMSREAPSIGVADAIFRGVRLEGFWLHRWNQEAGEQARMARVRQADQAGLQMEVAQNYPLSALDRALEHAESDDRRGRIVLC